MVGTLAPGPALETDEAIQVARAKRNRQEFAPLYQKYFDRVYAYCYRRLGTAEDAADLTSVIFARALAALHSCREESFRSWLFAIAHNAVTDQYRGRRNERPLEDALEFPDRGPTPEEEAISAEARATVAGLLQTLSDDQRQVIELRLAGLTSKEIGLVLGKAANAVDQLQFRAMTRLRATLEPALSRTKGGRDV
jgi:RNA polymerase sigma-70 factor, ECF subfamily